MTINEKMVAIREIDPTASIGQTMDGEEWFVDVRFYIHGLVDGVDTWYTPCEYTSSPNNAVIALWEHLMYLPEDHVIQFNRKEYRWDGPSWEITEAKSDVDL